MKPSAKRTLKLWGCYLAALIVLWPFLDGEAWRGLAGIGILIGAIASLYFLYSDN